MGQGGENRHCEDYNEVDQTIDGQLFFAFPSMVSVRTHPENLISPNWAGFDCRMFVSGSRAARAGNIMNVAVLQIPDRVRRGAVALGEAGVAWLAELDGLVRDPRNRMAPFD
jgi:hypothetical protein